MPCKTNPDGTPDRPGKRAQTPDCAASKSTTVTTPEGEKLRVNFNMGTGEVTYDEIPAADSPEEDAKGVPDVPDGQRRP